MAAQEAPEHKLKLTEVLEMLVADGMVGRDDADALIAEHRLHRHDAHPLIIAAGKSWKSKTAPFRILTIDTLTEWMAKKVGLEYLHIDPLKIDFTNLVDLMSIDYANRFAIMPIRIDGNEVVVATSEPFLRDWEGTL